MTSTRPLKKCFKRRKEKKNKKILWRNFFFFFFFGFPDEANMELRSMTPVRTIYLGMG